MLHKVGAQCKYAPWINLPRPDILSAGIGSPLFMHPEWFLAIYAFYRSKKYQSGPIVRQFIPKIQAGARMLTPICLPRPKMLSASIGLPSFMTPEWFLAIFAFCRSKIYQSSYHQYFRSYDHFNNYHEFSLIIHKNDVITDISIFFKKSACLMNYRA